MRSVAAIAHNIVAKGIAIRLDPGPGGVSRGRAWAVYDQDTLRFAAAWTGQGFIDWNGINFNGQHQVHPRLAGKVEFANPNAPGWANPENGRFDDLRLRGRDGRATGPQPRRLVHYRGLYQHGDRMVLSYTVGRAEVLEAPGLESSPAHKDQPIFTRTLNIGRSPHELKMIVAPEGTAVAMATAAGGGNGQVRLIDRSGSVVLSVPAAATPVNIKLLMKRGEPSSAGGVFGPVAAAGIARTFHERRPVALARAADGPGRDRPRRAGPSRSTF